MQMQKCNCTFKLQSSTFPINVSETHLLQQCPLSKGWVYHDHQRHLALLLRSLVWPMAAWRTPFPKCHIALQDP